MGQNLVEIRSNVVKKNKRTGISMGFFFIFCMKYTFTSKKVVIIEIPEWKFKTILGKNILEGNKDNIFAYFGSNRAKSDYFRGFYFSQSFSHILGNNITSVFLRDWKFKFCLRNSIFWPFGGQIVGPCWVKNDKKAIFIPATSLPTQFSLKEKFLRAIVF